jgi:small GTP-binding protein
MLKVVIVGDSGTGKTKLTIRYVQNTFETNALPTVGVDFLIKEVHVQGSSYRMEIWDTAGQEKFRTITESYFRNASGALIVYDVSNEKSFESAPRWLASLRRQVGDSVPVMLIGNKDDLRHTVDDARALEWAEANGLPHFFTSAQSGSNIQMVFEELSQRMVRSRQSVCEIRTFPLDSESSQDKCC